MSNRLRISPSNKRSFSPTQKQVTQLLQQQQQQRSCPSQGAKNLQDRLHVLLTQFSRMAELIKTWPESADGDSSLHAETTTKLIDAVKTIVAALEKVEGAIKADASSKKSLQDCKVPINLLDLFDHGNGLNPDCFSRGLLREALGQLDGVKRRKLALEKLGAVVQADLNKKPQLSSKKQKLNESNGNINASLTHEQQQNNIDSSEPATKKTKR